MTKVLLYVTADHFGGSSAISARSRFTVKHLLSNGVKIEVLTTPTADATYVADHPVHLAGSNGDTTSAGLFERLRSECLLGVQLSCSIWKLRKRFDLVILTSPPFFFNLICALTCLMCGKPYILDVRDRYPQVLFDLRVLHADHWAGRLLKRIESVLYRHAFACLSATHALSAKIQTECGVSAPAFRNGFDRDTFVGFSSLRHTQRDRPLRILIHGLFGRLFDAESFIDIARHCHQHAREHEFVLAGYGPTLQKVLDAALPNVNYVGRLTHEQVLRLLTDVDVGLSLHIAQAKDSFPVKVFEFVGAGLPCVVVPRSEAGEEIESTGMGWAFDPGDWLQCAQLFCELINNRNLLTSKAIKVKEHREEYSRQHQAAALLEAVNRWQLSNNSYSTAN